MKKATYRLLVSGTKIARLWGVLALILPLCCGCSRNSETFKGVHCIAYLQACEFENEGLRAIIDDEVLSFVKSQPEAFEGTFLYIEESDEDVYGRYLWVYAYDIVGCNVDVTGYDWWMDYEGYTIVVNNSAKKYFRETSSKEKKFDYFFLDRSGTSYYPPEWGIHIDGDSFEVQFRPENALTD